MTYKPVSIPSLPVDTSPALRQFLASIKEALEVRLNQRGSALDASPTFQDLLDTGILKVKDGLTTIGGKQYTAEQLLGVVQATIPTWITSDTAPPAPTGLVVGTDDIAGTTLTWDTSAFDQYAHTEVWRATTNDLDVKVLIGSTSGNTFLDSLPPPGTTYYYWIRDVAYNLFAGPYNSVNGTPTSVGPSATTLSYAFVGADVDLSWPSPTSNIAVAQYRIEYQLDGLWVQLDIVTGNSHRFRVNWSGNRTFRITAIDIGKNESTAAELVVTVTPPTAPEVSFEFNGEHLVLNWGDTTGGSLPVDRYEIYQDSVVANNLLAEQYATVYRTKVTGWGSTYRQFFVRSIDTAGNLGIAREVDVQVLPGSVINLTTQVIDNNVLFRWGNAPGSLPIASYELRRGATWETAELVGKKDGGFTTVFEAPQTTVTYTYWLAAVDTGGFYGLPSFAVATVSQPPDYVLANRFVGDFDLGTKTNAFVDADGTLLLPVNTSETWQSHFTSRSWAGPSAQVSAGYPVFIQPGAVTGSFRQDFDAQTILPAMKITVTYRTTTVADNGSVPTTQVTIQAALDDEFTSNLQTFPNVTSAYATNFQYVRVLIQVTGADDSDVLRLEDLEVKLDTKLKTQTGTVTVSSSGTTVYLTDNRTSGGEKIFIDVDSITVTALSTTPLIAIYDFVDTAYPLSFDILLFNASGGQVAGEASYQVRGF